MSSTPETEPSQKETVDHELPFMEHLIELRDRLMRAMIAIGVVAIVLAIWPGASALYDWLAKPLTTVLTGKPISIDIVGPFMVPVKVLFLTALVISLPFVLYQVWAFVAPGLYRHEKRLIAPLVFSSTLLFYLGMAFCYYFVFDKVFSFITNFAPKDIVVSPDIGKYLSFALTMFLAFGIAFEVPIAVVLLVRLGIVSVKKLKSIRGYVIVGAFVVAAIITPPDVISQLLLAIPMCILFEIGIWVSQMIQPKKAEDDDEDEDEDDQEENYDVEH